MEKTVKRITPEVTNEVIRLFKEGYSRPDIVKAVGYSRNSIDKILSTNNVFTDIAEKVEHIIDSKVKNGQYFIQPRDIMDEAIERGYTLKATTPLFHVISKRLHYHNYTRRSAVGIYEAPTSKNNNQTPQRAEA